MFLTDITPTNSPFEFMAHLIPKDKIIHKGVFNPLLNEYYFTLSDKEFAQFNVFVINKIGDKWSKPKTVFFNSIYSEHGMNFAPDGKSIYFSSTRPANITGLSDTWHIWKSDKIKGKWTEPVFIDIPNLRTKLVSHPTITNDGTLYFHSSNLDYSEMDIYYTKNSNNEFEPAIKANISMNRLNSQKCTPYVSPDKAYILFASIDDQLDLMIAFNDRRGIWINTKRLNSKININSQGNPFVTANNQFLFFTVGNKDGTDWKIKWMNIEEEFRND